MSKKTGQIGLRLDPLLDARLREQSARLDVPVSQIVRAAIKEWLKKNTRKTARIAA